VQLDASKTMYSALAWYGCVPLASMGYVPGGGRPICPAGMDTPSRMTVDPFGNWPPLLTIDVHTSPTLVRSTLNPYPGLITAPDSDAETGALPRIPVTDAVPSPPPADPPEVACEEPPPPPQPAPSRTAIDTRAKPCDEERATPVRRRLIHSRLRESGR